MRRGDVRGLLNPRSGEWLIVGHEHPAISLGDGVASHMKCPCFLVGENVLMLPAFSCWAAGTNIHSAQWSCPTEFSQVIAICNDKLLPLN